MAIFPKWFYRKSNKIWNDILKNKAIICRKKQ